MQVHLDEVKALSDNNLMKLNPKKCKEMQICFYKERPTRGETRALIGGGGEYSYIRVLPDEFLLKLTLMTADFKRNSSGRPRRYEYSPPPPINALVLPLHPTFNNLTLDDHPLEIVFRHKVLCLVLPDNLKWNGHVAMIVTKASKCLHILRVLKRSGIPPSDLIPIYYAPIRSVLKYCSIVWYSMA